MGHRASYAIRRHGRVEVFYSHWGALSVPQDVFWGPAYAEAFIRENEATGKWLDTVWAEGGAALDHDEKVLAFFGGEQLGYEPYRATFLALMQALWAREGWTVRWVRDLGGVATQVGVPDEHVRSPYVPPSPVDIADAADGVRDGYASTLIVSASGASRAASVDPVRLLLSGASILRGLQDLPTLDDAIAAVATRPLLEWEIERPTYWDQLRSVVLLDVVSRRIVIDTVWPNEKALPHLQAAWPGWAVELHGEGVAAHYARVGRPVPPELRAVLDRRAQAIEADVEEVPTEDQVLATIAEVLLGARIDPSFLVQQIFDDETKRGGEVWVNPSALRGPVDARPDAATAERLFALALASRAGVATDAADA